MKKLEFDALVIGGGSAGMAAASEIANGGYTVAVAERDTTFGGILNQCIHNGFGLHHYKEELTGPEYAERGYHELLNHSAQLYANMTVAEIDNEGESKLVYGYSPVHGMIEFKVRAVVLAMGCRERNRGNIGTPGTRPSGVYTAGLAQRLVNIEGLIPGKECVIVGSGDIGLIMARRMTWVGARVKAVVEIQPYPAGLTRNIVQCLNDFNIPLYLSHIVSEIYGKDRVKGVDITPLENGIAQDEKSFHIECDSVLLSVGLVPDNEVSKKCGVVLNPETNGARVDADLMTSVEGIFACGNVLHVHDLVDFVTEESKRCGSYVCDYLSGKSSQKQYPVVSGSNVKYTIPNKYSPNRENLFYLRSMIVRNNAELSVKCNGVEIKRKKFRHVQPSEMISFSLSEKDFKSLDDFKDNSLEIGLLT
jgi:NADPH-dependent 2,4-dienoyl-CoA reductase/sulfur reductase-like enzyme